MNTTNTNDTNDTNDTNIIKYNKEQPKLNYIPIGLIKSLCGNDRIFTRDLKPFCFKTTPKVVENTNIIVKFIGK